jgi:hypothetical protein
MRKVFMTTVVALVAILSAAAALAAEHSCLDCHREKTPGIVSYWERSAHPGADVGCTDCHGTDVERNHSGALRVEASVCGRCHEGAYESHLLSNHAMSLKTGGGCTRNLPRSQERDRTCSRCHEEGSTVPFTDTECAMFLAQSPEMQRVGCGACHRVETGCDTCHTKHGTDTRLAGKAEACGVCHMGPDHAQYEMWSASQHGVLFRDGGEEASPTCVTCHMPGGTHNVSRGIATGKPAPVRDAERDFMVDICARCHTPAFSRRSLEDADRIEGQSRALLAEAQAIVSALNEEGLLEPRPGKRPPHPLQGHGFVIGPHMLYEDISRAEAIFFRMMMFHYMSAFKGAFHQSPDYSHWFGNAPLKLALSELRSEAALLRKTDRLKRRLDNALMSPPQQTGEGAGHGETLKSRLRELRERMLRGDITKEEYSERKKRLLDDAGL